MEKIKWGNNKPTVTFTTELKALGVDSICHMDIVFFGKAIKVLDKTYEVY